MTHLNEFSPIIRDPTPEHAQNAIDIIVPTNNITGLLPNIFERLDNHEDSRQIALDTVFDVLDIAENQLNDGINVIFNSELLTRISDLVVNLSNAVIERATEVLV